MRENLETALRLVRRHEGGYVDHPADPGGCTNLGITLATYRRHIDGRGTCRDIRYLDWSQAALIYRQTYWGDIRGDDLGDGIDVSAFDFCVNSGAHRATVTLQRLVGAKVDGNLGPLTLAATRRADPAALIGDYAAARLRWLRGLKTFAVFGTGWTARVAGTEREALRLIAGAAAQARSAA
jgi:lysozyme family protein